MNEIGNKLMVATMNTAKPNTEKKTPNETNENAQNNERAPDAKGALGNQETDTVAMVNELMQEATTPKPTTTNVPIEKEAEKAEETAATEAATAASDGILKIPQTTTTTAATFVVPIPPPQLGGTTTCLTSGNVVGGSSSLKKKRTKSATKRNGNETRDKSVGVAADTDGRTGGITGTGSSGAVASNIKTSLSMTSLPPDDEKQESRDVIKAKLRVERPYNSLKKNVDRSVGNNLGNTTLGIGSSSSGNNKHHRYSWGSGHSQSSSSLQSSVTLGLGSGKDDLWAAIQTNYNYIMDTNLLDTCKEARCELEGAASVMENPIECCFKMLDETQRSEGLCEDPKELRKWLREMEHKLENAPSLSQATLFNIAELQRHLSEHSVLYHEIVSHARVVSGCIRAASEREQQQQLLQQQLLQQTSNSNSNSIAEQNNTSLSSTDETTTTATITTATTSSSSSSNSNSNSNTSSGIGTGEGKSPTTACAVPAATTSSSSKRSEGNLERLQNRYHLLYLKAFEVQLWLDGLLRKKSSSATYLNEDIDDDDDDDDDSSECDAVDVADTADATEDDLSNVGSDLESDVTNRSSSVGDLPRCNTDNETLPTNTQPRVFNLQPKADCEDGDDEEEDEDEIDCPRGTRDWLHLGYSGLLVTCDKVGSIGRGPTTTLTDFDADSESSDFEVLLNLRRQRKLNNCGQQQKVSSGPCPAASATAAAAAATAAAVLTNQLHSTSVLSVSNRSTIANIALATTNNVAGTFALSMDDSCYQRHNHDTVTGPTATLFTPMQTKMSSTVAASEQQPKVSNIMSTTATMLTTATTISTATQTAQKLQTLQHSNGGNKFADTPTKPKNIAVISPNTHHSSASNNKSPTVLRKRQQQQPHQQKQRHSDISKFNRSNRKSKNCAIFYFKHLDTDNETNYSGGGGGGSGGLSSSASHTSDLVKSAEASSDDDDEDGGWLYSSAAAHGANVSATASSIDCLNSSHSSSNSSNNNHIVSLVVDGIQSSTVSSTTSTTAATAVSIISDDSDKENKEALAAATPATTTAAHRHIVHTSSSSSLNSTQIATAEIQLAGVGVGVGAALPAAASTTAKSASNAFAANSCSFISSSSFETSNCSSGGSSCSSNELLTETTTSATATTQITQMHCQRLQRTEMELQISGGGGGRTNESNNNNNNSGSNSSASSSSSVGKNNKSQQHIISNNNCFNKHRTDMRNLQEQQRQQLLLATDDTNGNSQKDKPCFYTRADICNISVNPNTDNRYAQSQQLLSPGQRLPPRSPAKSSKSHKSNNSIVTLSSPTKGKVSHESIKQLVLEAEHLVCDEALKTPTKVKHSLVKISSTVKKREVAMPGPIKQRVQEWLAHQTASPVQLHKSNEAPNSTSGSTRTDDCEASGEASETDSIPQPGSDTSEGFTDSIATCMQTSTNSYGNSTERIGGSAEPINTTATSALGYGSSNQSLNVPKIVKRPQTRRKSERPWSVSCLSQLTTDGAQVAVNVATVSNVQAGLATHSISESALDSLSPARPRVSSASAPHVSSQVKNSDSKGSLRRRRTRKKKHSNGASYSAGKKTDSGSEETAELPKLTQTLLMKSCESMSPQQIQEITTALLSLQKTGVGVAAVNAATAEQLAGGAATVATPQQKQQLQLAQQQQQHITEETDGQLMKPNFRVGSYTTTYMRSEARLGSLAALSTYMHEDEQQGEYTTGTEDHHSSFSETAWDNYQEKYNSENYSEGFDSDAARRLTEFGDDYRNFLDSQSDCCSSLSAANNVDSLSPPRMDSLQQNEAKIISQDTIVSSVDHARRRRALELEYERRRKTLEVRRKSCQDSAENQHTRSSPTISLSSSANALTPKNGADKHSSGHSSSTQHKLDATSRKLEFSGMSHSAQSLRRTSESDTSTRRRKVDERRRSSRNLEKCIKLIPATSSSSCDDSDDEKEMRNLLQQSRSRLEDTCALKIRCHLLRPEDYAEIINTCRDNIRCLESVLRGPPGTVLSTQCVSQTKDLLAAWEDLLGWSENAAAARKMQEEMIKLKHALNRLGNKSSYELLDTEPSIQIAVDALKDEKSQLQNYRTNMLRLNASVHSWLTKEERKLQSALAEQQLKEAAAKITEELVPSQETTVIILEKEEAESEQTQDTEEQQQVQLQQIATITRAVATKTTTATITVIDSNGNQLETQTNTTTATTGATAASSSSTASVGTSTAVNSAAASAAEKSWDLQMLMNSESEFHKHLKDEVSDMYSAWDEADARINTQLEVLTNSLIAWRQLEYGLSEFQQALGQDRGTLKGLEGALDRGQATPVELAQNVKLVAKLLSEKVNVSQEQLTAVQEHLDPNHILHIAKFTASNGSLSDSGISDGGTTSDGGLSERERRLGVLRRLVKQLESALAPGSEAMKSIAARMESAEAELKNLQNTCRDLIVRTAATHQSKKQQLLQLEAQQKRELAAVAAAKANGNGYLRANGHAGGKQTAAQQQQNSPSKRKNKRKQRRNSGGSNPDASAADSDAASQTSAHAGSDLIVSGKIAAGAPDSGDPSGDPSLSSDLDTSDDESPKKGWAWRIAKAALPMQLALFTFLCAACLMQPNCCDNLNNLSMSFTPQLRYIRGPPPI